MNKLGITVPFHLKGGQGTNMIPNFRYLASLPFDVVLCGSEGNRSKEFAEQFTNANTYYVEVPQGRVCTSPGGSPELRKKFNDSIIALAQVARYDWYIMIGANDVISQDFFDSLLFMNSNVPTVAGVDVNNHWLMHHMINRKTVAIKIRTQRIRLAAGVNAYNYEALESCGYRPYQLDNCEVGMEVLAKQKCWTIAALDGKVLSLKDGTDLNTYELITKYHKVCTISDDDFDYVAEFLTKYDNG